MTGVEAENAANEGSERITSRRGEKAMGRKRRRTPSSEVRESRNERGKEGCMREGVINERKPEILKE